VFHLHLHTTPADDSIVQPYGPTVVTAGLPFGGLFLPLVGQAFQLLLAWLAKQNNPTPPAAAPSV
jgi:hypothetical protein